MLIDKIRQLPPQRLTEVEDFVDFLRLRESEQRLTQAASKMAEASFAVVEVGRTSVPRLTAVLQEIAAAPCPSPDQVLNRQAIGNPEKWDWVLPDRLFHASYASSRLDLAGAHGWCASQ